MDYGRRAHRGPERVLSGEPVALQRRVPAAVSVSMSPLPGQPQSPKARGSPYTWPPTPQPLRTTRCCSAPPARCPPQSRSTRCYLPTTTAQQWSSRCCWHGLRTGLTGRCSRWCCTALARSPPTTAHGRAPRPGQDSAWPARSCQPCYWCRTNAHDHAGSSVVMKRWSTSCR